MYQAIHSRPAYSAKGKKVILASWRNSTQHKYASILKNREAFYDQRGLDLLSTSVTDIITLLTDMFERGLSYSSICTARSPLSNFLSLPAYADIPEHNLIKRFIKGCFNKRSPQPRHAHTWDINQVLKYIDQMGQNFELTLKQRSLELVMPLTLLNIPRVETIPSFNIKKMFSDETSCTFLPNNLLKHSRPSYVNKSVTYRVYPHNPNLCPETTIRHYKHAIDLLIPNTAQFIVTGSQIKQLTRTT